MGPYDPRGTRCPRRFGEHRGWAASPFKAPRAPFPLGPCSRLLALLSPCREKTRSGWKKRNPSRKEGRQGDVRDRSASEMLPQPSGPPPSGFGVTEAVQERWRPLPRDQTHGGSGEGWVESDQLRWRQERRREMARV